MTLFFVGIGLIVAGAVLSEIGWRLHRREVLEIPEKLLSWFVDVLKAAFPLLVGPDSTKGQRVAALGEIIAAIGVLTTIAGLGVASG